MRWIDWDALPHRGMWIDWDKSIGLKTSLIYDDYHGEIEIVNNIPQKHKVVIRIDGYTPNEGIEVTKHSLLNCNIDMIMRKGYIFRYNVGDIINNLEILSCFYDEKAKRKSYTYRCMNDGYVGVIQEIRLSQNVGCPVCSGRKLIIGINDLNTTHPELKDYLCDPEDGYKYTQGSQSIIDWKCPQCGKTIGRFRVSYATSKGLSCKYCSDGKSYPNKFMANLLHALDVDFQSEFSPEWANGKFYDFYIKSHNLIIEMDGSFHYRMGGYYTDVDICETDRYKDNLAKEHGIEVIRINCDYIYMKDRYRIVKENTITALKRYFDLSVIDFDKINVLSLQSYIVKAIEMYNDGFEINDIANTLTLNPHTVKEYLNQGTKLNLCNYHKKIEILPVMCVETNQCFLNRSVCARFSESVFGFRIPQGSTGGDFVRGKKYNGLTFKLITLEQFNKIKEESPELCFGDV